MQFSLPLSGPAAAPLLIIMALHPHRTPLPCRPPLSGRFLAAPLPSPLFAHPMSLPSYLEEAYVELHACNESCSLSQPGPSSHSLCATGTVRFRHGCLKNVVQDCPSGARTCPGIQAVTSSSRSARAESRVPSDLYTSRLASMDANFLLSSISIRLPCLQSPGTEKITRLTHIKCPALLLYFLWSPSPTAI